jgi:hypothetical protein
VFGNYGFQKKNQSRSYLNRLVYRENSSVSFSATPSLKHQSSWGTPRCHEFFQYLILFPRCALHRHGHPEQANKHVETLWWTKRVCLNAGLQIMFNSMYVYSITSHHQKYMSVVGQVSVHSVPSGGAVVSNKYLHLVSIETEDSPTDRHSAPFLYNCTGTLALEMQFNVVLFISFQTEQAVLNFTTPVERCCKSWSLSLGGVRPASSASIYLTITAIRSIDGHLKH